MGNNNVISKANIEAKKSVLINKAKSVNKRRKAIVKKMMATPVKKLLAEKLTLTVAKLVENKPKIEFRFKFTMPQQVIPKMKFQPNIELPLVILPKTKQVTMKAIELPQVQNVCSTVTIQDVTDNDEYNDVFSFPEASKFFANKITLTNEEGSIFEKLVKKMEGNANRDDCITEEPESEESDVAPTPLENFLTVYEKDIDQELIDQLSITNSSKTEEENDDGLLDLFLIDAQTQSEYTDLIAREGDGLLDLFRDETTEDNHPADEDEGQLDLFWDDTDQNQFAGFDIDLDDDVIENIPDKPVDIEEFVSNNCLNNYSEDMAKKFDTEFEKHLEPIQDEPMPTVILQNWDELLTDDENANTDDAMENEQYWNEICGDEQKNETSPSNVYQIIKNSIQITSNIISWFNVDYHN